MFEPQDRDCEFLCRAHFPFNTQQFISGVEAGQRVFYVFVVVNIVVDVLPVQNVQILAK